MIHPNLIGCVDAYVDLEVSNPERKQEVLSQLKLLEGVTTILNFEGKGLFVSFYGEPGEPLSRKLRLICTMCGTDEFTTWKGSLPPFDQKLSRTDWMIIWAIRDDPRKSLYRIAKEAGVSSRTVNRRLTFLTEHRAFFLVGLPNFRQILGVTGSFLIWCAQRDEAGSIVEKVATRFENMIFGGLMSSHYLFYNIAFHNLSEAYEAREWIEKLQGVTKVRLGIARDMVFVSHWLHSEIKKRLAT